MMGTDLAQPARTRPNVGWDIVRLRASLHGSVARDRGVMISVPAAIVEGVVALRLANTAPSFYWRPAQPAATVVGWDAAVSITAQGADRFVSGRAQAQEALLALQCAMVDG